MHRITEASADMLVSFVVATLVAQGAWTAAAATPGAAGSSYPSRIAFDSDRGVGTSEIYLMNSDGSNLTRLTTNATHEYNAAISPDGTRIAFESNRTGIYQIYAMNLDGSNVQQVTSSGIWDQFPRWSPDGRRIVFSRVVQYPGVSRICVVNADGTGSVQISGSTNNDWGPDWSPDGTKIAFYSYVGGHAELYTMNPDGTGRQRITNSPHDKTSPRWSPDGTSFAYSATNANWSPASIHVVNVDGTADVALTDSTFNNYHPAWSPDGSRIVFSSNRTGIQQIHSMNVDGSDLQRLTFSTYVSGDWGPHWGLVPGTADVGDPPVQGLALGFANPVREPATIHFTTDREAGTRLEVFDSMGRRTRMLFERRLAAGRHSLSWDGRDDTGRAVPAGVYYCRLISGGASRTAKLVFVR
jgi:Tol biopolymer transport system component